MNFPQLLKSWRARTSVSQLELSLRCDVSQKHISFLESARSAPSREMVHSICEALSIPLRDRNAILLSAGFAPGYRETDLTAPEMASIESALQVMLDAQAPYPAIVVDRVSNILRANAGAARLQGFLFGVERADALPPFAGNVLRALFHPDGAHVHVRNWEAVASALLRRLNGELLATGGGDEAVAGLLHELSNSAAAPDGWRRNTPGDWPGPILTLDIEKDGVELRLFSTIATLGTPLDITLAEIRIESFFPADAATGRFFLDG